MAIKIPDKLKQCRFIKTVEKRPIEKNWQNSANYSYDEMSKILEFTNSYGVLCGINNLVVVDFDDEEIQNFLEIHLLLKQQVKDYIIVIFLLSQLKLILLPEIWQ